MIPLPYTLIDCIIKKPPYDRDILSNLNKKYSKARILAKRHTLFIRNHSILHNLTQHFLAERRFLCLLRLLVGRYHIFAEAVVRLYTHLPYLVYDIIVVYSTHLWPSICLISSTPLLILSTDLKKASLSSSVNLISMTFSTPKLPSITGTPTKRSLIPYSPSK